MNVVARKVVAALAGLVAVGGAVSAPVGAQAAAGAGDGEAHRAPQVRAVSSFTPAAAQRVEGADDILPPGTIIDPWAGGSGRRLTGGLSARSTNRAVPARVIGKHRIVIVPIYWQTSTKPSGQPSTAALAALGKRLNTYYSSMTGGRVTVPSVKVLPWRQVAAQGKGCSFSPSRVFGVAERAAGRLPRDGYSHVVAYMPRTSCGWEGLADVASPTGVGHILINGDMHLLTLAHEFGHNLGARHTGLLVCRDAKKHLVPWAPRCSRETYGDPWDLMSGNIFPELTGNMGLAHLMKLGLMPRGSVVGVSGTATVRLAPVSARSGVRGATFRVGSKTFYVEYRAPIGLDAWIAGVQVKAGGPTLPGGRTNPVPLRGIVVRELDSAVPAEFAGETDTVHFHAATGYPSPALFAGERYRAPGGAWAIAAGRQDNSGATITITAPRR